VPDHEFTDKNIFTRYTQFSRSEVPPHIY